VPDNSIGIARLFGPTGGYLLAFPLGALASGYLVGKIKASNSLLKYAGVFLSLLAGEALIIGTGALYLGAVYLKNMQEAFISGAAVFLVWTIAKVVIGTGLFFGVNKGVEKLKK